MRRVTQDQRLRREASERRISTSAAPPSEIELEFAGVTVPPARNAGFSVGIFSRFALRGCSSPSTVTSPLRVFTVIGAISPAKVPSVPAFIARVSDSIANASCASRVNW